jgi:cytochrome c556
MKMRMHGWAVAALAMAILLVPLSGRASEADGEYRLMLMKIARYHILAMDQILSGKVKHVEHVEDHARGLRSVSQMLPHNMDPPNQDGQSTASADERRQEFRSMVDQSETVANQLVRAARAFRKAQDDDEAQINKTRKELLHAFRDMHKTCWQCHDRLREE